LSWSRGEPVCSPFLCSKIQVRLYGYFVDKFDNKPGAVYIFTLHVTARNGISGLAPSAHGMFFIPKMSVSNFYTDQSFLFF